MAKKDKNIVIPMMPTIRPKFIVKADNYKKPLQRSAKFGPQLIAEGLLNGVTSEQGNLVKGLFDDPKDDRVDPACNINSDKFAMMANDFEDLSVDPVDSVDPVQK